MRRSLFVLLALSIALASPALALGQEWHDSPELAAFFEKKADDATFVLYDVQAGTLTGYNKERAYTRFIPASTFKIPNAVIGLSVGAVADLDEPLPYGGAPQANKEWERDMGLREAMKLSNVPIFQELARRIGLERMRAELRRIDYGNNEIGEKVDVFWLEGPLGISAVEQVVFLSKLAGGALPQPKEAQRLAREALVSEQGDGWTLYAKTGLALRKEPGVGWWVGWVEKGGRIYAFACSLRVKSFEEDAPKRKAYGMECLRILGVI